MARAHEQARLLEPADRTTEVRAINCENLESLPIHIANPTGDVCRLPIGWIHHRITVGGEASLAGRKLLDVAERNPRLIASLPLLSNGREEIADDRHGKNCSDNAV